MDKININKDKLSLGALIAFRKAEKRLAKKEAISVKEYGLTMGQFAVLEILYSKGDLSICEIINGILTTSGNVTVVIKNLKRDGFINQIPNPEDKRSSLISITDKGIDLLNKILPEHFKNIEDSFSNLTKEEKKLLIELTKKIQ